MRTTLISAISARSEDALQRKARRFLQGLSTDELQYIADFLGACALESAWSGSEMSSSIAQFGRVRAATSAALSDQEHKMILLMEYLRCCALGQRRYCSSRTQMLR